MCHFYSKRESLEGTMLFLKSGCDTTWIFVLNIIMIRQKRKVFHTLSKSHMIKGRF